MRLLPAGSPIPWAADIREACSIAGLDDAFAQDLIDKGTSVDQARKAVFAKMKDTNPPIGSGSITVVAYDEEKFRAAVVDGLCFRTNARADKPAAGHETFRAASIEYVARQCLERMGVNTSGLASRDQVAREILRRQASGGLSTSDFTSIFLDVANKSLLKAYEEAPATWRPIVNVVSASDFKTMYGISLSEAPDLDLLDEHGEYREGTVSDHQESYSVFSYGKMVYLTRKMIVNDDLRAFTRLPQLYGAASRRKESDLVWGKITGNPVMNDGKALFHTDRGNGVFDLSVVAADNTAGAAVTEGAKIYMDGAGSRQIPADVVFEDEYLQPQADYARIWVKKTDVPAPAYHHTVTIDGTVYCITRPSGSRNGFVEADPLTWKIRITANERFRG